MSSLVEIFSDKLIPWAQDGLEQRLVVARSVMKKCSLPDSVELTRKKIPGKRIPVRTRDTGKQKIISALWPEAGLHEQLMPRLICVLNGITNFQAGENVITCGEGHFILLPPHTPNTTGNRPHLEGQSLVNGSCELLQLTVFRDYIRCSKCYSQGGEHWSDLAANCVVAHADAAQQFHLFQEVALLKQERSDELYSHLLSSFLLFLFREIKAERQLKEWHSIPESTFDESPVQQMHDYIKSHLGQSLTIEKMAQQMYMSPSQFTRFVRRETGQSFVEILTEHRIEETKILLCETDWSIAAIARHVGFKSPNYFITLFGKRVRQSPGEYRNSAKATGKRSCPPKKGV